MKDKISIIVKLPNKLGDTIMATSFIRALRAEYPDATIDAIMEKSIIELKDFIPEINNVFEFSKKDFSGISGNYRFGQKISKVNKYDMYFCLPFSFSSALLGFFSKSKKRIGHNTEHRKFLLTHSFDLPDGLHVVEDYINLLEQFIDKKIKISVPEFSFAESLKYHLPENIWY